MAHFWTGYIILALSIVHASSVMRAMRRANVIGIWAASLAFALLLSEIVIGLALRQAGRNAKSSLRKAHFWIMILFVCFLGAHLWWNA